MYFRTPFFSRSGDQDSDVLVADPPTEIPEPEPDPAPQTDTFVGVDPGRGELNGAMAFMLRNLHRPTLVMPWATAVEEARECNAYMLNFAPADGCGAEIVTANRTIHLDHYQANKLRRLISEFVQTGTPEPLRASGTTHSPHAGQHAMDEEMRRWTQARASAWVAEEIRRVVTPEVLAVAG